MQYIVTWLELCSYNWGYIYLTEEYLTVGNVELYTYDLYLFWNNYNKSTYLRITIHVVLITTVKLT